MHTKTNPSHLLGWLAAATAWILFGSNYWVMRVRLCSCPSRVAAKMQKKT